MTCYIIHEITTNKHVLELSKLANEINRNKQYPIPNFIWVHYNGYRLFTNYRFPLLRTNLLAYHSKSEIYTDTYSYYDTTEKKLKSFKMHNLYNDIFASGLEYKEHQKKIRSVRSYKLTLDGNKLKKGLFFKDDREVRNVYHQLNSIYHWDNVAKEFIKSNSGWVDDYLRLLKKFIKSNSGWVDDYLRLLRTNKERKRKYKAHSYITKTIKVPLPRQKEEMQYLR